MSYILVIVTVVFSGGGIASDTRFQEFANENACETGRAGLEQGLLSMKGTMGREVFAACYPRG